jgi:hypothetical protein
MHVRDQVTPATILEELLRYAQAEPEETEGFSALRHDSEMYWRFSEKTGRILAAYEKYVAIEYEVQGPHSTNGGADIMVRYSSDKISDGEERCVAIRVQSLDENRGDDGLLDKCWYFASRKRLR